jgi:hypothetical protein
MGNISGPPSSSNRVEELLLEAEDCQLIERLATDPQTRRANKIRAERLRRIAEAKARQERGERGDNDRD